MLKHELQTHLYKSPYQTLHSDEKVRQRQSFSLT